jgi:hypothetical protein
LLSAAKSPRGKSVKKECFSEVIDHGDGRCTLFGRVPVGTPEDAAKQHFRTAVIPLPPAFEIANYVVNATFVTEDTDDANRSKPFFPCVSEHTPDGITVVAGRRRDDANASSYVCEYIVAAVRKK